MPGVCLNSWQREPCEWSIGYLWHFSDGFERLVFVGLALMLIYTACVFSRFCLRYYSVRRESRPFEPAAPAYTAERHERKLVADLKRGLGTLRAVASLAPYLGLAGTCDGVMYRLMGLGIAMSRDSAIVMLASEVAAALITTAAGIIVAVPAILVYNFLQTRIEGFKRELVDAAVGASHPGAGSFQRSYRLARTLPLQERFSCLPPFALFAAPVLASLVAIFTFFQPYEGPTGLSVQLLSMGSLDEPRYTGKPIIFSVVRASGSGSPVVRLNSREIPLDDFNPVVIQESGVPRKWRGYVEAESTLPWADVVTVLEVVKDSDANVVLLTTTPSPDSRAKKLP
jgi:hypothetical protein